MRQTGDLRSVVRFYRREANIDTGNGQVDYGFLWRSYAEVYHLSDKALAAGGAEFPPGCSASSCERRCNAAFCRVCVWCMMAGHMR